MFQCFKVFAGPPLLLLRVLLGNFSPNYHHFVVTDRRSLILFFYNVALLILLIRHYLKKSDLSEIVIKRKKCAIVLFGNLGSIRAVNRLSNLHDIQVPQLTYPSLKKNVVEFNKKEWTFDFFFHSWNASVAMDLASLYNPLAYSAGEAHLHGRHVHGMYSHPGRMQASQELALQSMWDYCDLKGKLYDRVLLVRFDVVFHNPFNMKRLFQDKEEEEEEEEVLYVAHWCKALGHTNVTNDGRICRTLIPSFFENVGLPDFYFAGSDKVMRKMFKLLLNDYERGIFQTTSLGNNHGLFLGRVWSLGLTLRHYYFHQMDFEIYRSSICNSFHEWCSGSGLSWLERDDATIDGFVSGCNAKSSFCSCGDERERPWDCELGAFFH